ncbi:hypothetical protein [Anaerotalea alkaliphila]|uniref:Uncharacterized protein n=1 Tax=Anaerotalea alkaliphila TaxID=2662126 RepID=A0A7X5KMJ3_9FIRM|nr:hypothetical protein [Anaerotalea alkaliphila]NDL66783.1 hypothetical protein [Anaerotalea alkaliphila]
MMFLFQKVNAIIFFARVLILALAVSSMTGCDKAERKMLPEGPVQAQDVPVDLEAVKADLLEEYVFYTGVATVMEDQSWVAKYQDGTHGEGDALFTSVDYLVHDPRTGNCHLLARDLTYSSQHAITVNDMHGAYISTAHVNAAGELSEYYGTGLLTTREVADADPSGTPSYQLDFSANPVRIDGGEQLVLTLPPTRNRQWVAYTSTADTVRLGVERVLPPDGAPNASIGQMPGLDNLSDTKTYGNRESRAYEATSRIWNVKGTFSYTYRKIGHGEAMDAIDRIREENLDRELYEALAQDLPRPWRETAVVGDHLQGLADASVQAGSILDGVDSASGSGPSSPKRAVELTALNPEFQEALDRMKVELEGVQGDQGALRSLEGAVLETSGADGAGPRQKKMGESYTGTELLLAKIFGEYEGLHQRMEKNLQGLRELLPKGDALEAREVEVLVEGCRALFQEMELLNRKVEALLEDLNATLADLEDPYGDLEEMYARWPEIADAAASADVSVDVEEGTVLPEGYPSQLVPVIGNAVVAVTERVPGEGGAPDGYMVTLKSGQPVQEVLAYYQEALKGLEDLETVQVPGTDMVVLSGTEGSYLVSVMVTANTLGGPEATMVQIMVSAE